MRRALQLASMGQGRTSPNPMVGAVVVRDGTEAGWGYHQAAGYPHAEAMALERAGPQAQGATLYVNLEPCNHHSRTPPCTEAILAAGIQRVVVAMGDPDPRVGGRGIRRLREAGVEVTLGVLEEEGRQLNAAYVKHRSTGLPWVTAKWAMSADGRMATRAGQARWITGTSAREFAHRLRDQHDAVLVGCGTALRDDPALTCRIPGGRDPLRVVVDSQLHLPPNARMLRQGSSKVVVATTPHAAPERKDQLQRAGAEVWVCEAQGERVSLQDVLRRLAERGVLSVLAEGGAELHASLFCTGLVDRVVAFVGSVILGGRAAPGPVAGHGVASLADALRLENVVVRTLGSDVCLEAEVRGRLRGDG